MNKDCVIVVTSCFKYRDVLNKFEFFFQKYWSDCPFEVWLSIDKTIDSEFKYDKIIVSDNPQNLLRMRAIEFSTPYVIMMQDDHWLINDVDTKKILQCIEFAKKYDCGTLRLLRDPITNDVFSSSEELYIYNPGAAYRISARGGLWNTQYLELFINKYIDLWEMERFGNDFANSLPQKVLATKYRVLPIIDAVHKGKYEDFAAFLLDANNIDLDREVLSAKEKCVAAFKATVLNMNPSLITKIQSFFNIGYKPKYKKIKGCKNGR